MKLLATNFHGLPGHPEHPFRSMFIVLLVIPLFFGGCAKSIKWDQQNYIDHKALAIQKVSTWSFNSGFFSCAIAAAPITFPTTIKNSTDLQALVNNPATTMGLGQLDDLTRKLGKWNDQDYWLGCFQGTQSRLTISQIVQMIKVLYPQASGYLPSFGQ